VSFSRKSSSICLASAAMSVLLRLRTRCAYCAASSAVPMLFSSTTSRSRNAQISHRCRKRLQRLRPVNGGAESPAHRPIARQSTKRTALPRATPDSRPRTRPFGDQEGVPRLWAAAFRPTSHPLRPKPGHGPLSDEFTAPLCRGHHRELHRSGDEVSWGGGARASIRPERYGWKATPCLRPERARQRR
jgi:hypothetical protein